MGAKDLHSAVSGQNLGIVRSLIHQISNKGGKSKKISYADEHGLTCLHKAALVGNAPILSHLLTVIKSVDSRDCKQNTPLHYAAFIGSVECTKLLLDHGADPNALDNSASSALHIASREGHLDVCRLLLQSGCSLKHQTRQGNTAIDCACETGRANVLSLLLQQSDARALLASRSKGDDPRMFSTALHIAAANGHCECLNILIDNGCDINYETSVGTALHEAAIFGKIHAVRLLLDRGIDVMRKNRMGETALDRVNRLIANNSCGDIKELLQSRMSSKVRAIKPFPAGDPLYLSMNVGDVITVTEQLSGLYWRGTQGDKTGLFPKECVEAIPMRQTKTPSNRNDSQRGRYSSPLKTQLNVNNMSDRNVAELKRPSSDGADKGSSGPNLDFSRFKVISSGQNEAQKSSPDSDELTEEANRILMSLSQPNTLLASEMQVLERWFRIWNLEKYAKHLVSAGYDSHTAARMSSADLAAVGITDPKDRAKLVEILHDRMRDTNNSVSNQRQFIPSSVPDFLDHFGLGEYTEIIMKTEFKDMSELMKATVEDLMELGISKLGHQKKIVVRLQEISAVMKKESMPAFDGLSVELDSALEESTVDSRGGSIDRVNNNYPKIEIQTDDKSGALEHMPRLRTASYRNERPLSTGSSGSRGSKGSSADSRGSSETLREPNDSVIGDRSRLKSSPSPEPDPFQNIQVYPGQSLKRPRRQNAAHVSIDPVTSQPVLKSDSSMMRSPAPLLLPSLNPRPVPLSTFSSTSTNNMKFNKPPPSVASYSTFSEESEDPYYMALPPEPPTLSSVMSNFTQPESLPAPPDNLLADTPTDTDDRLFSFNEVPPPLPPKRSDSRHQQNQPMRTPLSSASMTSRFAFPSAARYDSRSYTTVNSS